MRAVWLAAVLAVTAAMIGGRAGAAEDEAIELDLLEGTVGCEDPQDVRLLEAALQAGDITTVLDLQTTASCRDLSRYRARIVLESDGLVLAGVWHTNFPDYRESMWFPIVHVLAAAKAQGLLSDPPAEEPAPKAFPLPFDEEAKRLAEAAGCENGSVAPPASGLGRLYSCILGRAETIKLFVNEAARTGRPSDVALIWNDWTKDGGFGLHADAELAFRALAAVATLYAPAHKTLLLDAFSGDAARTIEAGDYRIEFDVHQGLEIDERVLRVLPAAP